MKGMMEYKGYYGSVKYNEEGKHLYGKIEFIRDLVDYQEKNVEELQKAFEESVDEYLSTCAQLKKEPDKPFKGSFNIRITENLHREASCFAINQNISLNELVSKALKAFLENNNQQKNVNITIVQPPISEEATRLYPVVEQTRIFNELVGDDPESHKFKGERA